MKFTKLVSLLLAAVLALPAACAAPAEDPAVSVVLSDEAIAVDGAPVSADPDAAVYVGAEIVYYHDGTDATYGEGTDAEKHDPQEAAAHTVVTITQPGTYRLSGALSKGQIAIDLGEDAKDDPDAVVTLILDNVDVTCTVAPALIFYNVYECDREWVSYGKGENPDYKSSATVDTSAAGANVILADGSENNFTGSHVARIYKEGTTENLHRYDGAFYSRMSMNLGGNDGVLNIVADDEGLDSELHLTVNGGVINVESQDDGVNTSEDNASVATINGGTVTVNGGNGAEGDGIDSNGYLVINGGAVRAMSNDRSADGGIDADLGIFINGGTLSAFGVRNDSATSGAQQPHMELSFASTLPAGSVITLKDPDGAVLWSATTQKACQSVTLTTPDLKLDVAYRLYVDDVLQCWSGNSFGMGRPGGFGGQRPEGMEPPEGFDPNGQPPELPDGQAPDGQQPPALPDGQTPPMTGEQAPGPFDGEGELPQRPDRKDFDPDQLPEGFDSSQFGRGHGGFGGDRVQPDGSGSTEFTLTETVKSFSGVCGSALPFTDVSADDPGRSAIQALYKAGAMEGTGNGRFSPDMTLTRAQAVTVLARLAGAEAQESDAFSDVAQGSWYAGYVGWAVDNGIVQGDGAGHFYPDMAVTADQMALMLSRYRADYQNTTDFEGELTRSQLAQMAAELLD